MTAAQTAVAANTREEILSQPCCWRECFNAIDKSKEFESLCKWFRKGAEYLFIGCGSSSYVSQAAAVSWEMITGASARAIPASELLLFPDLVLNKEVEYQPILVSRSGQSSEIVQAARYLEHTMKIPTLAISCSRDHPLDLTSGATIHVPAADEKSVVMTRSFSSMLLELQSLAAYVVNRKGITAGLRRLPEALHPILDTLNTKVEEFVQARAFANYVFLASISTVLEMANAQERLQAFRRSG